MDNRYEMANSIVIANIIIPEANKERSWALPNGCRWFTLQVRDGTAIRIAVESGKVAESQANYYTLKTDNEWDEKELGVDITHGLPLYFACAAAGKVVEVLMGVYKPEGEGGV